MNGLDLFSGIGGISLALRPWVRTTAYCEKERYAAAVLLQRMWHGDIDSAPIWDDVRTLRGSDLPKIDIISGGFPCTDISCAGRRAGLAGEDSKLFFEMFRLVKECRPQLVFIENPTGILVRGGVEVRKAFDEIGYVGEWDVLSAFDVGAPQLRNRAWFLAADSNRWGAYSKQEPFQGSEGKIDNYWTGAGRSDGCKAAKQGRWVKMADHIKPVDDSGFSEIEFTEAQIKRLQTSMSDLVKQIEVGTVAGVCIVKINQDGSHDLHYSCKGSVRSSQFAWAFMCAVDGLLQERKMSILTPEGDG